MLILISFKNNAQIFFDVMLVTSTMTAPATTTKPPGKSLYLYQLPVFSSLLLLVYQ